MAENAKEKEAATAKNKVKIEDVGPCKKKIIVEIPEETIKQATDKQYQTLRKDALVPGFRKGRVPRRLLEKRFGKETKDQIKLQLLVDATESSMKDNNIDSLDEPDFDQEKIELPESGPLKFDFEVEVRPEFDLPKLEGIAINKTELEVTDKQVEDEIKQLQKWAGLWTPRTEGAVQLDDQIIADAILKVEGVEEDEKLDNIEIFVRQNGFVGAIAVEKLDELLVGAKAGDTKQTTVEVPKTYYKEEYRGKKVDIKISIKDIKWLKPAELNEDLFRKYGVGDEEELQEKFRDMLQNRLAQQSKTELTEQVYKYMLDNTKFDLPTEVVADQANMLLQRQYANLMRRGLSQEQLAQQAEQLKAGNEQRAKEQLKTFFIMDKVAEKLKVEVTEEEVNGYIAQTAIQRGQRPERLKENMVRDGSLTQFKLDLREEKCVEKLLETAKITEVVPKKEKKTAKKADKKTVKSVKKAVKKSDSATKSGTKKAKTEKKKTEN